MPRRRDMTLDCLDFEWDSSGTAASARAEVLTRPMAYEVARVLLLLVRGRRTGDQCAPTVASLAGSSGLTEHDVRAAVHDLLPTGCVVRVRERRGRRADNARWAHGVELMPRDSTRGPGRRPRLMKLALLVEPNLACGDLMDVLLRRAGVLAVQATDAEETVRLLDEIGFDLVVVDSATATGRPGAAALAHAVRAAACDRTMLLRRPDAPPELDHHAFGSGVTISKPFAVREFEAALDRVSLGALTVLTY